jgi:nitrogen fixation/metabolism regulation signal transduction histidine kinase
VLSVIVTITLVAWGVLVFAAIDFGREARSNDPDAWTFLALASVGATACLFLTMILGARLIALVRRREVPPARTRRVPGRRAAR